MFAFSPVSAAATITLSPSGGDDTAAIHAAIDDIDEGGTIYFEGGTFYANIVINDPGKSFSLVGAGAGSTILDGEDNGSILRIEYTGDCAVTVEGFTITNGSGTIDNDYSFNMNGGGIYIYQSKAVVSNCIFIENYTNSYGGGLYSHESDVALNNCTFEDNTAGSYGGGIDIDYSSTIVNNCTFLNNDSGDYAGGMDIYYSKATVTNSTFENNYADYGGGVYVYGMYENTTEGAIDTSLASSSGKRRDTGSVYPLGEVLGTNSDAGSVFTDCTFKENDAEYGGGMYNDYEAIISIATCTFEENSAYYNGGGIENYDTYSVNIDNCLFTGNYTESGNGGGMHNCGASLVVSTCIFEYNVAEYQGGGMMNGDYSEPIVTDCIFRFNEAYYQGGGGMMNAGGAAPHVISCTFTNNWAENRGGGMYNAGSTGATPIVTDCIFSYNEAGWRGAGMDNHGYSEPYVTNCVFVGNVVIGEPHSNAIASMGDEVPMESAGGGGMFNGYSCVPTVINCTFTQNSIPYYSSGGTYDGENGGGVKFNTSYTSTFTNCVIWGNFCGDNPNEVLDTNGDYALITYSNVGGGWPGEGNIDADPLFVNAPTDVALRSGSPCIDAGTDMSPDVVDDILGVARPQYRAYDMGAYEYVAKSTWSPVSIMPLARTQLAYVLEEWNALSEQLPEEPSDEMTELIERIQEHMGNATGLANPIYASGELAKALSLMGELSALMA
ncbi:hypothetical protein EF808_02885 [archaeon]|nr:MAG: hypothetical protein EF808_02885 [archaeon]